MYMLLSYKPLFKGGLYISVVVLLREVEMDTKKLQELTVCEFAADPSLIVWEWPYIMDGFYPSDQMVDVATQAFTDVCIDALLDRWPVLDLFLRDNVRDPWRAVARKLEELDDSEFRAIFLRIAVIDSVQAVDVAKGRGLTIEDVFAMASESGAMIEAIGDVLEADDQSAEYDELVQLIVCHCDNIWMQLEESCSMRFLRGVLNHVERTWGLDMRFVWRRELRALSRLVEPIGRPTDRYSFNV